uniref:protein-histidine N-methyltransferase n=1 Tax=Amblyomma maculatum TaxID=34609 RepID=G3MTS6_AMBMU
MYNVTLWGCQKEWKDFLEVQKLLQEVRELEKPLMPDLPKRSNKWPAFLKWCSENGAYLGSVAIKDRPDGDYGLVAEEKIEESMQFLGIPMKLVMTTASARKSKLGPLLRDDPIMKSMSNVALAIFLILELSAGESSFWHPYISVLPDSFNTVLYFNIEELELLSGSAVLDEALKLHRSIARQYAYFHKIFRTHPLAKSLPFKDCFTYDLYRWAVSAVMTRQNAVPWTESDGLGGDDVEIDGTAAVTALVPLWDMCNHSDGKVLTDYDSSASMVRCYAMRDFDKGEEVTIFYGKRTNAEFFIHNGFVFEDNRYDAVDIKLGVSKKDPLFAVKSKLCEDHDLSLSGTFALVARDRPVSEDLSTFLRILVLKDASQPEAFSAEHILTSSDSNARDALTFLVVRIELLLKAFPKSDEEYEDIIKDGASNARVKMAARLRLLESKVLASVLETLGNHVRAHEQS